MWFVSGLGREFGRFKVVRRALRDPVTFGGCFECCGYFERGLKCFKRGLW